MASWWSDTGRGSSSKGGLDYDDFNSMLDDMFGI